MQDQKLLQELLKNRLGILQKKNPSYSLRAYGEKLGVGAGPLSQIIQGKRKVSKKIAQRICEELNLDPTDQSEILRSFPEENPLNKILLEEGKDFFNTMKVSDQTFKLISRWQHFAILSLINFQSDIPWIAGRLGIKPSVVEKTIEELVLSKTLIFENKKLIRNTNLIRSKDNVPNQELVNSHLDSLDYAKEALQKVPCTQRDFTQVTFPADPALLDDAKLLIRKFQDDLTTLMMGKGNLQDVFRLSIELYPMTKAKSKQQEDHGDVQTTA